MKINKIKINSYGKLKEKEIELKNNLNIIYGKNESGKSTILKFIINTLYGASKNKRGKEISDFDRYKPWDAEQFSGKLYYELDNSEKYEIYREFNKKNPTIFNEKGDNITKEFNIDKNKGSEFFYEQTKIKEEIFLATSIAMQQETKIEKETQNILIQKISNILGTGQDNISYKKAIEKINKKQLEEIGTERSREKPINIIQEKMRENQEETAQLKEAEKYKYEIEKEIETIKNELKKDIIKKELLREIKKIKEKDELEKEKIKIKENIILENDVKVDKINNEIETVDVKYKETRKGAKITETKYENIKLNNRIKIWLIILIIINALWVSIFPYVMQDEILRYIILVTLPIYLIIAIISKRRIKRKIKDIEKSEKKLLERINSEKHELDSEKKVIERNSQEIKKEIDKMKADNNYTYNMEKQQIINNYSTEIESQQIKELFIEGRTDSEKKFIEEKISNEQIELSRLEVKRETVEAQIERQPELEEKRILLEQQYKKLQRDNLSIELTKKLLEKAYKKMKNQISPIFTKKLCEHISKITNGKYNNIYFSDEQGLTVELDNGNYISAERLSIGTIEQLYLSLRLAMIDTISNEKVPIILDETFAYYDDERLRNILKYLVTEFAERQIIIFTCTKRECEIIEKEGIEFNYIEL
ncbi:MAG: AAA family ATPase [Clostridia bacterium]|nr:AAA family ATPase [Clostridia bacterium]